MPSEDPTQDLSEALASRTGGNEIETFMAQQEGSCDKT